MSLLSNTELEARLSAAGKSLLQPPSSLDEILTILDRTEELLLKVAQSPSKSMQTALSPLMKALVSEKLLKHSDIDVQVGVAACISEITRITAPDAPYDDDKMKDAFQLIVSSFNNLSDTSSRSHQKRATILETVAKIRSCVIMLDLELDQMIIEMFQHFLKSIRVYHAKVIFASMEIIMSLVFEESEDISPDLLNPILDTLKKNNKEVLPIAKKLAKRVIQNGADKLRPCLTKAIDTLAASLDDYNEVIASVCQKNFGHSDENNLKDQQVAKDVKEAIKPLDKDLAEDVKEEFKPQQKDHALNGSPNSIDGNSINETGNGENTTDEFFLKEVKSKQQFDTTSTSKSKSESDDMGTQKPAHLEDKADYCTNGDTQPFNFINNSAESSDLLKDGKQEEQIPSHQEFLCEQIHSPPVDADKHLDTVKDTTIQLSPNIASQILSSSPPDKNQSKRSGRTKRKENMVKEETVSTDPSSKKKAPGANIAEVNKKRRMMKHRHGEIINMDKALIEGVNKNDAVGMSDSEARYEDLPEKLGNASNKSEDGSSSKKNRRKGGRVEPKFEKDTSKHSATEDNGKDTVASLFSPLKTAKNVVSQEETPKISTKRKQTPGAQNTSQTIQYGKNMVGSKLKVWWPDDRMFYEGVIASFDPVKKKHKVLYDDGDAEVLNLRREQWEFVGDDSVLDGGLPVEHSSHVASSNKKKTGHANSETSSKQENMDDLPGRTLKRNAAKSGSKSKDDGRAEPESAGNSEEETDKPEDPSQKFEGKSPDGSANASSRSQNVDVARTSSHRKDIRRTTNSKVKSPQSGNTLSPIDTGVKKSNSMNAKQTVRAERTVDRAKKSPETLKGAKTRGSGTKSGKKRR